MHLHVSANLSVLMILLFTYTVFSRVSAHLRVSAHPHFLMILWFEGICVIRTNKMACLCKQAPTPVFWPVNFKRPWALARENTVITWFSPLRLVLQEVILPTMILLDIYSLFGVLTLLLCLFLSLSASSSRYCRRRGWNWAAFELCKLLVTAQMVLYPWAHTYVIVAGRSNSFSSGDTVRVTVWCDCSQQEYIHMLTEFLLYSHIWLPFTFPLWAYM